MLLIASDHSLAPEHYLTPAHSPPGLTGLRCARLDDGSCEPRSPAIALIDRFSMLGLGDFRALEKLAAAPASRWAGAELAEHVPFGAAAMDGCDIEIAEPAASLGPIMITAPDDRRVFAAYQAFSDAMEADDALTASAIGSTWLGELHMVFRASSAAKATQLRAKLEAYRALLRHAPEAAIVGPDDSSAYARTITRAVVRGQVTTHGRDVRLDTTVSPDAAEKAWFEQSSRSRAQRYAALARVLTHALAREAIPDDDAHALGGDALVAAMNSRRGRVPNDGVDMAPLLGFDGVRIPVGQQSAGASFRGTVVRWPDGGAERVDAILDVLKADGFSIDLAQPTVVGARFVAHRGASGLSIRVRRNGGGVEARFAAM